MDVRTESFEKTAWPMSSWARTQSRISSRGRLQSVANVSMVTGTTSRLPAVDRGQLRPGTVAPNVLTGILRDSLHFQGLVVTDALNMAGVADKLSYVSTAGGAFLEWMEGKPLPGVEVLRLK